MKFTKEQCDPPPAVEAWTSDTKGTWRVELIEVLFGRRIMVRYGMSMGYEIDYCAGADLAWQRAILLAVMLIIEKFSDDVAMPGVRQALQRMQQRVKPMCNDLHCWHELAAAANLPQDHLAAAKLAEARGILVGVPAMSFHYGKTFDKNPGITQVHVAGKGNTA